MNNKDTGVSDLKVSSEEKDGQIRKLEEVIGSKETHINNLDAKLKEKEVQIQSLETSLRNKNATLNYIYHSYGMGALWVCNKMVDKLFPPNTKRRSLARLILKSIRRPDSSNTGPGGHPSEPSA